MTVPVCGHSAINEILRGHGHGSAIEISAINRQPQTQQLLRSDHRILTL